MQHINNILTRHTIQTGDFHERLVKLKAKILSQNTLKVDTQIYN